jgi:arginyl-tRNA synthetase
MYDTLGITFDRYYFNSMAEQPGKVLVNELIERGIATDERPDGPVFIKIDEVMGNKEEKYRVLVILRSDGTALYATEDLALAGIKFADFPDLVKCLYVVDVRQSLHFQQVFKVLDLAGRPFAKKLQHVPYELVSLPGNVAMSSREGTVVLLEDLIREATSRAMEIVEAKNPELPTGTKAEIARAVAIGGIKYPMLTRDNTKIVTFDWQSAMDINGQAAPYIQYAHVRASSILRKANTQIPPEAPVTFELTKAEVTLVDIMARLAGEVQKAAAEHRPLLIANLAFDLAQAFNDFYNQCPVLQAEESVRAFRLRLVAATRQAISNSLALLGITAPQAM